MSRRGIVPAFGLLSLLACTPKASTPPDAAGEVLLRTYEVPPAQVESVRSLLNQLLSVQDMGDARAPTYRTSLSPDGRLVVAASQSTQESVRVFLAELAKRPPPPPPSEIEVTYFLVLGAPSSSKLSGVVDPEIAPALQALGEAEKGLSFHQLEKLSVRSVSDEVGEAGGSYGLVSHRVTANDGRVLARTTIDVYGEKKHRLQTRTYLSPGQTAILGETGFFPSPEVTKAMGIFPGAAVRLYYVVRARVQAGDGAH